MNTKTLIGNMELQNEQNLSQLHVGVINRNPLGLKWKTRYLDNIKMYQKDINGS